MITSDKRSRAVRPPSCVQPYVPFFRISAIRYTNRIHTLTGTHSLIKYTHTYTHIHIYTRTRETRREKKWSKTSCYALSYRFLNSIFNSRAFSNVGIFVINEELACHSYRDTYTRTRTHTYTHTHTQDMHAYMNTQIHVRTRDIHTQSSDRRRFDEKKVFPRVRTDLPLKLMRHLHAFQCNEKSFRVQSKLPATYTCSYSLILSR